VRRHTGRLRDYRHQRGFRRRPAPRGDRRLPRRGRLRVGLSLAGSRARIRPGRRADHELRRDRGHRDAGGGGRVVAGAGRQLLSRLEGVHPPAGQRRGCRGADRYSPGQRQLSRRARPARRVDRPLPLQPAELPDRRVRLVPQRDADPLHPDAVAVAPLLPRGRRGRQRPPHRQEQPRADHPQFVQPRDRLRLRVHHAAHPRPGRRWHLLLRDRDLRLVRHPDQLRPEHLPHARSGAQPRGGGPLPAQ